MPDVPHPRLQPDRLPIQSVVMDCLGIFLGRIGPGLEHFKDEEIVVAHEPSIGHLAFEIGETLGDEGPEPASNRTFRTSPRRGLAVADL
jgi:hypothetical protein